MINGRVHHFRGEYNVKSLREFARKLMPAKLVISLDSYSSDTAIQLFNQTLIQTIADNKVMALFLYTSNQLTLRFQTPCLQMITSIQCVSIKLASMDEKFRDEMETHFAVETNSLIENGGKQEVLVIFKENMGTINVHKPAYSSRASELSFASILQVLETNRLLNLPRLSSLQHFYDICPSWQSSLNNM